MDSPTSNESYESLLPDSEKTLRHAQKKYRFLGPPPDQRRSRVLIAFLSTSLIANLVLVVLLLHPIITSSTTTTKSAVSSAPKSKYAGLERNREEPYILLTNYSSDDLALQDKLWHDINVDDAVVALSDDWAAEHGLRTSQRFPWDESKGIYILHGFHNLHCIKIIHLAMAEYREGVEQTRSWHHVAHCMDALRRQIMCDADDTPRATDRRPEVYSGVGQHRMCRNWDDLISFSRKNTACYKRPETPSVDGGHSINRYKHCPPDSGYVIRDDYVPTDPYVTGLPLENMAGIL